MKIDRSFARPLVTRAALSPAQYLAALEGERIVPLSDEDRRAAEVLISHLFASSHHPIDGIEYHGDYALAEGAVGGDIVDVYHFDNGDVALSVADISGKGAAAAIHAALVKYGLRCYASEGLTPERVLRSLDRAYLENNAFERTESFASVFFAVPDKDRRSMTYASAGHEPVLFCRPGKDVETLPATAPLIGIFDDQHHLFKQKRLDVEPGTVLVAATDGITEARSPDDEFFGIDRLIASVEHALPRKPSMQMLTDCVLEDIKVFTNGRFRDDIATLALRVL